MLSFEISVNQIEELQTLQNIEELNRIFSKAERMLVGGGTVVLLRRNPDGSTLPFDEFTTTDDLAAYKERVYKYLPES